MQSAPESVLKRRLLAAWYGRWPVFVLIPLSLLFAALTAARRVLYLARLRRVEVLPVPVVVVGNLVVGGAGKTPLVAALASALRAAGQQPGIVSRGHGGRWRGPEEVLPDSAAEDCGDEALLLARSSGAPVVVGRDRAAAARHLLSLAPGCSVILSDDGLQHYALGRDVELVVIDRRRGLGNGWQLPAGPLREPVHRLASVHGILLHGTDPDPRRAQRLAQQLPPRPAQWPLTLRMDPPRALADGAARPWPEWQGTAVHAVAGIGDPERFFSGLRSHGLDVQAHPFPDHHAYRPGELAFAEDSLPVLLTAKDAVKWAEKDPTRYWVVPLEAQLPAGLLPWLLELLEKARGRKNP